MTEANELLRSAYAIARRKGESTNWDAFIVNLEQELLRQAGVPNTENENTVEKATCTAKTYRLPDVCDGCGGSKMVDTGGFTPWGQPIEVPCPDCR